MVYPAKMGPGGLVKTLHSLCEQSEKAAEDGYQLIILSDRGANKNFVPVRLVQSCYLH
jgi:hypothetical protein